MVDRLPEAACYCTDGAEAYTEVDAPWTAWPDAAWHLVSITKEETYLGRLMGHAELSIWGVPQLDVRDPTPFASE